MDIHTLAIFSTILAVVVASALLLSHKYIFSGPIEGVNLLGFASLLLGLSIFPLAIGMTQSSITIVFFSNCAYTLAFCLILAGITLLRGAQKYLIVIAFTVTGVAICYFLYNSILAPSINYRIEARSAIVFFICMLAIYANYTGTYHDNEKAKFLLSVTLILNALFMAIRVVHTHMEGAIVDYYSTSDLHRFSFIVIIITVISIAFIVLWLLTARLLKQTLHASLTDELTGLYNRKGLSELLPKFLRNGHDKNFSILLADLDHFKKINDTYGHEQGDMVIKQFGQLLQSLCRKNDACFRYGGEEFLIILPDTSSQEAAQIADRIRMFAKQDTYNYTVSIGVTQALSHDDWPAIVRRVDVALYKAKENGRDRVALC